MLYKGHESSGFLHALKWLSALVAKGFPCVLCVFYFHIWDQILAQICTDVFEKLPFQVKNKETVVKSYYYRFKRGLLIKPPKPVIVWWEVASKSCPVRRRWFLWEVGLKETGTKTDIFFRYKSCKDIPVELIQTQTPLYLLLFLFYLNSSSFTNWRKWQDYISLWLQCIWLHVISCISEI